MKIAYLKGTDPAPKGVVADLYLNADYFNRVVSGAKSVVICGKYPNISNAYTALKIPVIEKGIKTEVKAK